LTLKVKGSSVIGEQKSEQRYDSTTPDEPTEYPFASACSAMIGQSFMATVTRHGRIKGLEGIDEMHLRIAEKMAQGGGVIPGQRSGKGQVEQIRKTLKLYPFTAEGQITEMVGNLLVAYPGRPVAKGDSWQAKKILFSDADVDVDCTYTVKEETPTSMVVAVRAKIDLDDDQITTGAGLTQRITMTGSYEGTLEIDPASGWLLRKRAAMHCSGELKTPPTPKTPQGTTMPVTMETTITVEPVE
jgi:hypothetical protein